MVTGNLVTTFGSRHDSQDRFPRIVTMLFDPVSKIPGALIT
jgi:hypothetical protein